MPSINDYALGEVLGEGNFGVVYSGTHNKTSEDVAIKFETQDLPTSLLKHEAKVLLSLKGTRGIPRLISYGSYQGVKYMVMNRMTYSIDVSSLSFYGKSVKDIESELSGVLRTIHSKGFVHRDVKPDNIMFDSSGNVTLIDFGFATNYSSKSCIKRTKSESYVGTKEFLGPLGLQGYVCPEVDIESSQKTMKYYRDYFEKLNVT